MTTAIDTNVIIALWVREEKMSAAAQSALDAAANRGALVVAAPVYAELLAAPRREESFLNEFFDKTGIVVDWDLDKSIWRLAGLAFSAYTARRRRSSSTGPRRILADFLIGAHALQRSDALLTLDDGLYRTAFPDLDLVVM